MAEVAVDLTDDQIEKLLSEAESRLAAGAPLKTAALAQEQQRQAVTQAPSSAAPAEPTGDEKKQDDSAANKSRELSVRVPQQRPKKGKSRPDNAGPDWGYMPRTKIEDPKVKREFQLLRMRGVLDPKKHFKKESRKDPFPQFSQMGTLIEGPTEFYSTRLTRKQRKRTLVEEVLASAETNAKLKTRYNGIQEKKTSGKKAFYKKLMARRKRGP